MRLDGPFFRLTGHNHYKLSFNEKDEKQQYTNLKLKRVRKLLHIINFGGTVP